MEPSEPDSDPPAEVMPDPGTQAAAEPPQVAGQQLEQQQQQIDAPTAMEMDHPAETPGEDAMEPMAVDGEAGENEEERGVSPAPGPEVQDEIELGDVGIVNEGAAAQPAAPAAPQQSPDEELLKLMTSCRKKQETELRRLVFVYRWLIGIDPLSGKLIPDGADRLDFVSDDEEDMRTASNIMALRINRDALRKLKVLYSQNPTRKKEDLKDIAKQLHVPEQLVLQFFAEMTGNSRFRSGFPSKRPQFSKMSGGRHRTSDPLAKPKNPKFSSSAAPAVAHRKPVPAAAPKATLRKTNLSDLDRKLEPFMNSQGGVRNGEVVAGFVAAISGAVDVREQPSVLMVLAETESVDTLRKLQQAGMFKILNQWLVDAKAKSHMVVIRLILRMLHKMPMSLESMKGSGIGKSVNKLKAGSGNKSGNDPVQKEIIERAKFLVESWSKFVEDPGREIIPGPIRVEAIAPKRPRPEEAKPRPAKKERPTVVTDVLDEDIFARQASPRVEVMPLGTGNSARPPAPYKPRRDTSSNTISNIDDIKRIKDLESWGGRQPGDLGTLSSLQIHSPNRGSQLGIGARKVGRGSIYSLDLSLIHI
eukprot:TRINITY_DN28232_c0_g1_i1.p1 TRINITY_DN28232_c0_g1~~TRINITY_DN28232_c0_g1_i1.p1  ORF type:complete len:588 (+),score=141.35 TRINITY_DN28232_c0_g1_i1:108-1871(+)